MQSIKIQHEAFAIFRFYSCKYRDGGAGGTGGAAPYFSRGKMFLFKYKVHALSTRSTCHFTSYRGWRFLEKYLIENVENTISEPLYYKI